MVRVARLNGQRRRLASCLPRLGPAGARRRAAALRGGHPNRRLLLDKFHNDLFGYFWVAAYAVAVPALIYLVAAAAGTNAAADQSRSPLPPRLRLAPAPQAIVFSVYGAGPF